MTLPRLPVKATCAGRKPLHLAEARGRPGLRIVHLRRPAKGVAAPHPGAPITPPRWRAIVRPRETVLSLLSNVHSAGSAYFNLQLMGESPARLAPPRAPTGNDKEDEENGNPAMSALLNLIYREYCRARVAEICSRRALMSAELISAGTK